jgi:glycosyltransferase involved in cell wall biosynthesis
MKIAFDLTQIPPNKTGIGIYALNLVRQITAMDLTGMGISCVFFAQDDDNDWQQLVNGVEGCHLITISSGTFRKLPLRFFFEQFMLPRQCKKLNIDVIYSFHYTMPYFTGIKRVVTIPDMTFYLFPQMHEKIKRIYFKGLIPFSLRRSDQVVTISQSAKADMLQQFSYLPAEKISVIHLGVTANQEETTTLTIKHLQNLGIATKKYFLYVGTLEPRKNITAIIEAFQHLIASGKLAQYDPNEEFKLVLAGGKGWFYESIFETVKKYHLEERVIFPGYVEEELKQTLLQHAFGFVYPSFYEGFGLPVLEAMVYGVPVITSNISSLPEVAGDAALLIDPNNYQEIADAMTILLSQPEQYRLLAEKSMTQAHSFSWHETAKKTMTLLKNLYE